MTQEATAYTSLTEDEVRNLIIFRAKRLINAVRIFETRKRLSELCTDIGVVIYALDDIKRTRQINAALDDEIPF